MFCSIIIPFKNSGEHILKTLKSVEHQTLDKSYYETILINDFSTDNSKYLIKKIIKNKKNFKLFHSTKKTIGPGHARNLGVQKSKGKYVYFLDHDDYLKKNTLDKLINIMEKQGKADLICNNFKVIDKLNNLKKKTRVDLNLFNQSRKKIFLNFFNLSFNPQVIANLINKNLIVKNKIYFSQGYFEDIYFFFKVLFFSKKIICCNSKLYIKYNIKNSIVNTLSIQHLNDAYDGYHKSFSFLVKKNKNYRTNQFYYKFMKTVVGQTAVLLKRIEKFNLTKIQRKQFYKIVYKIYHKYESRLKINYRFITKKDKIVRHFLNNTNRFF